MDKRRLARFNKRVTNRVQGVWAPYLPPWAVIVHRGRKSGREYRTPVIAAVADGQLVVGLLYGPETEWAKNLIAVGSGAVIRRGRSRAISNIRRVDAADRAGLPRRGRWLTRVAKTVVVADIARD